VRKIILILLLLLLYFGIGSLEIHKSVVKDTYVDEPYEIIKEVNTVIPKTSNLCDYVGYRYSVIAGDVEHSRDYLRPNLIINNLENQWGQYKVRIYYVLEEKFPYSEYGGANLAESFSTGRLSYEDAEIVSDPYEFYIGPFESVLVNNRTRRTVIGRYWAFANITEPKKYECFTKTEYSNVTENRTFTEYKSVKKEISVKEYTRISEIISLQEWVIFVILFIIMLTLLERTRKIHNA
jgi:hypothetical protein